MHPPTGRVAALKVVTIALTKNSEVVVKQLGDLYRSNHPNVAAFYGAEYDTSVSLPFTPSPLFFSAILSAPALVPGTP